MISSGMDTKIIYEEARKEWRNAERKAADELEAALAFARKQYRDAVADADRGGGHLLEHFHGDLLVDDVVVRNQHTNARKNRR